MKYDVHVYAVVRTKLVDVEATSQEEAVRNAMSLATAHVLRDLFDKSNPPAPGVAHCEWEDGEPLSFLVDEHGDWEHEASSHYLIGQHGNPVPMSEQYLLQMATITGQVGRGDGPTAGK